MAKNTDGQTINMRVCIGVPEHDPESENGDFRCLVEVAGFGFSEYAYGADAIQSYCLAMRCLRHFFEPLVLKGWKFYFPQDLAHDVDLLNHYF